MRAALVLAGIVLVLAATLTLGLASTAFVTSASCCSGPLCASQHECVFPPEPVVLTHGDALLFGFLVLVAGAALLAVALVRR